VALVSFCHLYYLLSNSFCYFVFYNTKKQRQTNLKTSKTNTSSILIGFILGVVLVACIGASQGQDTPEENKSNISTVSEKSIDLTDYQSLINENYKIYSMPMPENANFAGEKVPLENIIVKESFDKELLSNTYWQSNTFYFIKRANRWFPTIEKILKEQGVPDDFKYLAVIESGLLNVTSPSGAKGYWQFMPATAKGYNLEINNDVDERKNLEKSTLAACQYLKEAYKKFGNWTLAAASYNMGKTGLLTRLQNQKADNYYDLALNEETARYVYRILAVKYILNDPINYGFNLRKEDLYPPYQTVQVLVDTTVTSWVNFAISQGTNYKTLKELNPWLVSDGLENESGNSYTILLPLQGTGLDNVGTTNNKYGSDE
jgi:membrane-bound lytic murein transglycosylase D